MCQLAIFYINCLQQKSAFQIQSQNRSLMNTQGPPLRFSSLLAQKWTGKEYMRESREFRPQEKKANQNVSRQPTLQEMQMIGELFKTTTNEYFKEFADTFVFGVDLKIWRKGRSKDVVVFIDHNMPNFLWVATKSKTFLFDLVYTNLENSDVELKLSEQIKHYFVLHYFSQKIPFIFQDFASLKKIRSLFYSALSQHQNLRPEYPPYLSKLIKYYTVAQMSDNHKKVNSVSELLRIAEELVGPDKRELYEDILKQMTQEKGSKGSPERFQELILSSEEMMQFFKVACCNENIRAIYQNYCGAALRKKTEYIAPLMTCAQFGAFLVREQNQTEQHAEKIATQHFQTGLSFYEFCNYLFSKQYNYLALNPPLNENLPLNEYSCYSSHNTYLSGNQITSDSKVQRYLEDLTNGLKCLQIDVHDWGDQLIVTHALRGLHLNKEVSFEEVIKEIANYCKQTATFYPIILSIENRTNKESYFKMANIFQKYLGNFLLDINQHYKKDTYLRCHTLAQLKNKVIIKTDSKVRDLLSLQKKHATQKMNNGMKPLKAQHPNQDFNNKQELFQEIVRNYENRKSSFQIQFKESYYLPLDQITRVTALFKSEDGVSNQNSIGYESTSVTSKKLQQFQHEKIVEYTKRSFLRIYPLGTQIASSNYNPVPALEKGAQIIALNTQTKDDYAWLMMSYFSAGVNQAAGLMGYIEKPIHLRSSQPKQKIVQVISISVLSTIFNTKIKFYGSTQDMKRNQENSLNFEIADYQVGFLMFEMENGLKDCIPTRFIREGYRVIIGRNSNYIDCGVRVLLRVKVRYLSQGRLSLTLI